MVDGFIYCCQGSNLGLFLGRAWFNLSAFGFCLVSTSSCSNNQTQNPEAASDTLSRLAEPRSQLKDGIPSLGALLIPWPPSQGVVPLGPVVHVGGTATELAGSWDLSHRIVWRS